MDLSAVLPASVADFSRRSNMITIFCAIPELGSIFPVDIDIRQTVGHLKNKIKEAAPDLIRFDADMLKLYLARDDGAWLNSNDRDVKALERREVSERVGNLMQEHSLLVQGEKLNHDALFGKRFKTAARDIHVLVEMPEDCEFPGRSNMATIFCAIPELGSIFPVDIDIRQTVGHLKAKIKEAKPNTIRFDAGMLKLFLAKDRGGWLKSTCDDFKALKRGEIPDQVKNLMEEQLALDETWQLDDNTYFGRNFKPAARDIHILVKKPEDPKEFIQYERSGSTVCKVLPLQSLQSAAQWLFGMNQVSQTKKAD